MRRMATSRARNTILRRTRTQRLVESRKARGDRVRRRRHGVRRRVERLGCRDRDHASWGALVIVIIYTEYYQLGLWISCGWLTGFFAGEGQDVSLAHGGGHA